MAERKQSMEMTDDQYRALLTERETEIITGEADVSDNYRYRTVSRVRNKIQQLERDADVLAEHHPTLREELRGAVCEDSKE